jgi:TRAP-type mannitol/chloroaromatic compound transport system permease small subunit
MLAFRFGVELATYALLAWAGASANAWIGVRIVLAIVLPLIVIVIWFRWMAPQAQRRLREPARLVAELVIFLAAAAVIAGFGHVVAAVIYAVVAVGAAGLSRWLIPGA